MAPRSSSSDELSQSGPSNPLANITTGRGRSTRPRKERLSIMDTFSDEPPVIDPGGLTTNKSIADYLRNKEMTDHERTGQIVTGFAIQASNMNALRDHVDAMEKRLDDKLTAFDTKANQMLDMMSKLLPPQPEAQKAVEKPEEKPYTSIDDIIKNNGPLPSQSRFDLYTKKPAAKPFLGGEPPSDPPDPPSPPPPQKNDYDEHSLPPDPYRRNKENLDRPITAQDLMGFMATMARNQTPAAAVTSTAEAKFKPAEVGYFDPHLSQATYGKGDLITVGQDTYHRDVHLFLGQAKTIALTKGFISMRQNLHLCLRGDALAWYTAELDELQRGGLQTGEGLDHWERLLTARFQMDQSEALTLLSADQYTIDDVRKQRSLSEYVQQVARHGRDAGFSVSNQIIWAYNHLAPGLQRDIDIPSKDTTILQFISQLEARKGAWFRYYEQKVSENRQPRQFSSAANSQYNSYQNQWQPQANNPYRQQQEPLRQWNGPRDQQRRFPEKPYQRRIEPPPQNQQKPFGPRTNAQPNQPTGAYHGETTEEYEDDSVEQTIDDIAPEAQAAYGMQINFNDTKDLWRGMQPFACHQCPVPAVFGNDDELRDHVLDVHGYDTRSSQYSYIKRQFAYQEHARDHVYTFHAPPKGYAKAEATVFDTHLTPCIDTGSGGSVIDRSLLPPINLYGIIRKVRPVTLRGVCGLQVADEVVKANVMFKGVNSDVEVPIEAYVIDNLQAGLIIGLTQLEDLDTVLYLKRRMMTVQGQQIPLLYDDTAGEVAYSMHLRITKPTFIIHAEREKKWAAVAKTLNSFTSILANQISVLNDASELQNKAPITRKYADQLDDSGESQPPLPPPVLATPTTPIPTHACKRCNLAFGSNRHLRLHRCPRLPQHRPDQSNNEAHDGRKRFGIGNKDKWSRLGLARHHT